MGRFTGVGVEKMYTCIQLGCLQEHEFLGVCMHLQILMITLIRIHSSIFIGEVFQIEVSDGLVHPLGVVKCKLVLSCGDYWGTSFQEFVCV